MDGAPVTQNFFLFFSLWFVLLCCLHTHEVRERTLLKLLGRYKKSYSLRRYIHSDFARLYKSRRKYTIVLRLRRGGGAVWWSEAPVALVLLLRLLLMFKYVY